MNIRKGRIEDMPAVLGLIKELATFEKEPHAVVVTVNDLERDGFGVKPLFHTFIAEENDEIVGMALYYYRYSTWKGKTIHLEDLIVIEGFKDAYTIYQHLKKHKLDYDYQIATPKLAKVASNYKVHRAASYDTRFTDHSPVVVEYAI